MTNSILVRGIIVLALVLPITTPAWAARQPMALATQQLKLKPNGKAITTAYCLDRSLVAPYEDTLLEHVVDGEIQACFGGSCVSLEQAIADGVVRVTGARGYKLVFENLRPYPVKIDIRDGVVSDTSTRVSMPKIKIGSGAHSNTVQYDLWRALGQIGDLVGIRIVKRGNEFAIEGADANHREVTFGHLAESDLSPLITHLALSRRLLLDVHAELTEVQLESLVNNIRLRTSASEVVALINMTKTGLQDFVGPTSVSTPKSHTPNNRTVVTTYDVKTSNATLPAKLTVSFRAPESLTVRERIADAATKVVENASWKTETDVLTSAKSIRDAVKQEVKALRSSTNWSRDAVYILIGDLAKDHIFVRIPLSDDVWEV